MFGKKLSCSSYYLTSWVSPTGRNIPETLALHHTEDNTHQIKWCTPFLLTFISFNALSFSFPIKEFYTIDVTGFHWGGSTALWAISQKAFALELVQKTWAEEAGRPQTDPGYEISQACAMALDSERLSSSKRGFWPNSSWKRNCGRQSRTNLAWTWRDWVWGGGRRVTDVPGAFRNKLAGLSSHPQDSPSSAAAWITAEAGPW